MGGVLPAEFQGHDGGGQLVSLALAALHFEVVELRAVPLDGVGDNADIRGCSNSTKIVMLRSRRLKATSKGCMNSRVSMITTIAQITTS